MSINITELQCKEVICVSDGRRLGFVSDVELEIPKGQALAIVVPGPGRLMGLFGAKSDFVIPWGCIRKIGPDIILVDVKSDDCLYPKKNSGWLL